MKAKSGAWAAGVVVLAVVAGGALVWKFSGSSQKGEWTMPPAKVAVAPAVRADFPTALTGIGSLEATRQVQVPAEVDGRVTQILFTAGQRVQPGQVLVQMNDAPEQGELA
ncbi:MAG TPA: biotin/lipoyl-binding protein, partial [Achromobacter sp.]|uniref:biotin/lipoyl-binding protein n=1 Tax=Achromobacter sp. TaxID=134375 RepID=UPI002F93F8DB